MDNCVLEPVGDRWWCLECDPPQERLLRRPAKRNCRASSPDVLERDAEFCLKLCRAPCKRYSTTVRNDNGRKSGEYCTVKLCGGYQQVYEISTLMKRPQGCPERHW